MQQKTQKQDKKPKKEEIEQIQEDKIHLPLNTIIDIKYHKTKNGEKAIKIGKNNIFKKIIKITFI